jgi:hypothetical protein
VRLTLRTTALLALGGFAVHQARYALVPDHAGDRGHAYLVAAPLVLVLLAALALGHTLTALARRAHAAPLLRAPRARWLAASGALLGMHLLQELGERIVAGGGALDAGTVLVVPLCLVAGAVVALAARGEEMLAAAAHQAAARAPRLVLDASPVALALPARTIPARRGLARHLAGRAPPALG